MQHHGLCMLLSEETLQPGEDELPVHDVQSICKAPKIARYRKRPCIMVRKHLSALIATQLEGEMLQAVDVPCIVTALGVAHVRCCMVLTDLGSACKAALTSDAGL